MTVHQVFHVLIMVVIFSYLISVAYLSYSKVKAVIEPYGIGYSRKPSGTYLSVENTTRPIILGFDTSELCKKNTSCETLAKTGYPIFFPEGMITNKPPTSHNQLQICYGRSGYVRGTDVKKFCIPAAEHPQFFSELLRIHQSPNTNKSISNFHITSDNTFVHTSQKSKSPPTKARFIDLVVYMKLRDLMRNSMGLNPVVKPSRSSFSYKFCVALNIYTAGMETNVPLCYELFNVTSFHSEIPKFTAGVDLLYSYEKFGLSHYTVLTEIKKQAYDKTDIKGEICDSMVHPVVYKKKEDIGKNCYLVVQVGGFVQSSGMYKHSYQWNNVMMQLPSKVDNKFTDYYEPIVGVKEYTANNTDIIVVVQATLFLLLIWWPFRNDFSFALISYYSRASTFSIIIFQIVITYLYITPPFKAFGSNLEHQIVEGTKTLSLHRNLVQILGCLKFLMVSLAFFALNVSNCPNINPSRGLKVMWFTAIVLFSVLGMLLEFNVVDSSHYEMGCQTSGVCLVYKTGAFDIIIYIACFLLPLAFMVYYGLQQIAKNKNKDIGVVPDSKNYKPAYTDFRKICCHNRRYNGVVKSLLPCDGGCTSDEIEWNQFLGFRSPICLLEDEEAADNYLYLVRSKDLLILVIRYYCFASYPFEDISTIVWCVDGKNIVVKSKRVFLDSKLFNKFQFVRV